MQGSDKDPVLVAIARVELTLQHLVKRVDDQEKRLRWVVSVAILAVGAVGGPDALRAVGGP